MALIRVFEKKPMDRNSLHREIKATYSVFEFDSRVLVQINTYGSAERELPGKTSQTIQLDRVGAENLVTILKDAFKL